jgi:polyadenylate-binding protein
MSAPATSTTPVAVTSAAAAPATTTTELSEGSGNAPAAPATAAAAPAAASGTFQSASLYVGDLHNDITEGLLFELFNRVGPVASIRVCRDTVTRRSLGYAYVNFHDVGDAERALDTMQFTEIKSKACRIMWSQRDPSLRKSGVGNIFVKNLDGAIDNKQLFDIFSMFGNILSCKVAVNDTGASKGYGYVHFETAEAAKEAVAKLNGATINETEVSVTPFVRVQDRAGQPEWTNLYVKQFPTAYSEEDLTKLFAEHGEIASVFINKDDEGKSKGFGFVNFADHESAEKALEALNGKNLADPDNEGETTELYVSKGQKKSERTREIKAKVDALQQEKLAKFNGMNLFVKNLDDTITEEILRESFDKFGTITSAKIVRDEQLPGNPSKGFGYVCYSSPEEATRAVTELNGKILRTKPITVALHQSKEQRRAHLAATYQPRNMRGYPGGNMGGPAMPYMNNMYVQQAQQFPGGRGPVGPQGGQYNGFQPGFAPGPRGQMGGQRGGPQGYIQPGPYSPYGGMQMGGPGNLRRNMPQNGPGGNQMGPGQNRRPMANNAPRGAPSMNRPLDPRQNMMPAPGSRGAPPTNQQRFNQGQQQRMPPQQMLIPMQQQQQMMQQQMQQNAAPPRDAPLDDQALAAADPETQKQMIGERLYPLIYQHQEPQAGKITGMLLEMDNSELLNLIESPDALLSKIQEALEVLKSHNEKVTGSE